MKIYTIQPSTEQSGTNNIDLLPDTALLRNNETFYMPDYASRIEAQVGFAFQINKIGKCVAPQFALRYLSGVQLAVWFRATDAEQRCHHQHRSTITARGFDKSFAVSPHSVTIDSLLTKDLQFFHNQGAIPLQFTETMQEQLCHYFAEATRFFTCKIGDLFYLALPICKTVQIGDLLKVTDGENVIFQCAIG